MNTNFIATEARILVYGEKNNYFVSECNNQGQVDYAIAAFGKPEVYMDGFTNWKELAAAKRYYQHMLAMMPGIEEPDVMPTREESLWFLEHMLKGNEHFWSENFIKS